MVISIVILFDCLFCLFLNWLVNVYLLSLFLVVLCFTDYWIVIGVGVVFGCCLFAYSFVVVLWMLGFASFELLLLWVCYCV